MRYTKEEFCKTLEHFKALINTIDGITRALGVSECCLDNPASHIYEDILAMCDIPDALFNQKEFIVDNYLWDWNNNYSIEEVYDKLIEQCAEYK